MKQNLNIVHDFVCVDREMVAKGGSFSFRQYVDKMGAFGTPGAEIFFDDGTVDKRGRLCGKGFSLNQSHYNLQAREGQVDYQKRELKEFFLNAPFCEASPNGQYATADGKQLTRSELMDRKRLVQRIKTGEVIQNGVKIRLKEDAVDAKIKLAVGARRAEAQVSASQIDDVTLSEIAALLGYFGEPDDLMRDYVFEFAGKKPVDYFELLNSNDRGFKAVIRKAIEKGVLTEKGTSIYWNKELIGANEDAAVSRLQSDKVILDALIEESGIKIDKPKGKK